MSGVAGGSLVVMEKFCIFFLFFFKKIIHFVYLFFGCAGPSSLRAGSLSW